jgi:hypothetical protein
MVGSAATNPSQGITRIPNEINVGRPDGLGGNSDTLCAGSGAVCLTTRRTGDTVTFRENVMARGSIGSASGTFRFDWLGCIEGQAAPNLYIGMSGWMFEVFILDRYVSDEDIDALVEGYLRPRWCLVDCPV